MDQDQMPLRSQDMIIRDRLEGLQLALESLASPQISILNRNSQLLPFSNNDRIARYHPVLDDLDPETARNVQMMWKKRSEGHKPYFEVRTRDGRGETGFDITERNGVFRASPTYVHIDDCEVLLTTGPDGRLYYRDPLPLAVMADIYVALTHEPDETEEDIEIRKKEKMRRDALRAMQLADPAKLEASLVREVFTPANVISWINRLSTEEEFFDLWDRIITLVSTKNVQGGILKTGYRFNYKFLPFGQGVIVQKSEKSGEVDHYFPLRVAYDGKNYYFLVSRPINDYNSDIPLFHHPDYLLGLFDYEYLT